VFWCTLFDLLRIGFRRQWPPPARATGHALTLPMIQKNLSIATLLEQASSALESWVGGGPRWSAVAPGRVNVIGEHTDYNGGWMLPMAIDRYTVVVAAPGMTTDGIRVRSLSLAQEAQFSAIDPAAGSTPWARYLQGVVAGFIDRGATIPALDLIIASSVPAGGGLSSSAALTVAMCSLLQAVTEVHLTAAERIAIAIDAERHFAGVPCGNMDQTVVEKARADHALLIDCATSEVSPVPFAEAPVLVIHSGVSHQLADSAYALRRTECARACEQLGVGSLRDVTLNELSGLEHDPVIFKRARHVLSENQRVLDASAALRHRDWPQLGKLMRKSHESLRGDYEVSCEALDCLVELADAQPGVFGARLTGGGFGGCVIVLVEPATLVEAAAAISASYQSRTGLTPQCYAVRAADGADRLRASP